MWASSLMCPFGGALGVCMLQAPRSFWAMSCSQWYCQIWAWPSLHSQPWYSFCPVPLSFPIPLSSPSMVPLSFPTHLSPHCPPVCLLYPGPQQGGGRPALLPADSGIPGTSAGICSPAGAGRRHTGCREGSPGEWLSPEEVCEAGGIGMALLSPSGELLDVQAPPLSDARPACPCPGSSPSTLPCLPSLQAREQLQADLLRCQAKIEDLEKLLMEKGQVSGHESGPWALCVCLWWGCGQARPANRTSEAMPTWVAGRCAWSR